MSCELVEDGSGHAYRRADNGVGWVDPVATSANAFKVAGRRSLATIAEDISLEDRLCDPLQLCAHLSFRLNMRRAHHHAIGTRVE